MKKFLNKKVNMFGKAVPVFAFVILGLALTSAALVPYISNVVTGTVSVEAPLELKISENNSTWVDDITFTAMHGGETLTLYTWLINNANNPINGVFTVVISNSINNVTCEDFTSVTFDGVDAISACHAGAVTGTIEFDGTTNLDSLESDYDTITATFALNVAPSTYTFTSAVEQP